jgi:ribosomal protein S1
METGMRGRACTFAVTLLLAAAPMLHPILSVPANAQASGMAGIGASDTVVLRGKVTAIDQGTRMVTLVGPKGGNVTVKVGDEVRNLPQVKVGDTVNVLCHASVTYVLSPRGAKTPDNSTIAAGTRAAAGQMPAGALDAKVVVTSTVVGVDLSGHKLQLIDPSGGLVRTVDVVTPEGQQSMKMVKVGDSITGVASLFVAVSVQPAS